MYNDIDAEREAGQAAMDEVLANLRDTKWWRHQVSRRVWRNRLIYWLVTFVMCWGGNGALYLMGLNTAHNMLLGMAATVALSVPIGFLMWRMPNK